MGLTGKFKFRKTLWGKIVLQIEEEVKPFWSHSKPNSLKPRWRDATSRSSFALEATSPQHGRDEAHAAIEAGAPVPNGEVRRIAH